MYVFRNARVYMQVRCAGLVLPTAVPYSNHAVSVVDARASLPHMKQLMTTLNNALLQQGSNIGIRYLWIFIIGIKYLGIFITNSAGY